MLKRLALLLVMLELAYLAVFNLALYLPLTQDLVNRIKPDKFNVSWDRAWTPWPFRVYAKGVAANGQARSQQWELHTPEASASISLFPLLFKRVSLKNIQVGDVRYYQRPRPKAGKDYSAIRQFFPPVQGRELETEPPQLAPIKAGKKPWHVNIRDIQASGRHTLWLYQLQAELSGNARTDLSVVTRGGPFSLSRGEVDIDIGSLTLNGNREVASDGHLVGTVALQPFKIKENKGRKSIKFLELDMDIKTRTRSLAFLNIYLEAFEGMKLGGAGNLEGRVVFKNNRLLPNSDVQVSADELTLELLDYRVAGDGGIRIRAPESKQETHFAIAFNDLDAYYAGHGSPLLTGDGLVMNGIGSDLVIPTGELRPEARQFSLSIASLKAPDLSLYQRFIPEKWALKLLGGEGELVGQLATGVTSLDADFQLSSSAAEVGIKEHAFSSNLNMRLMMHSPDLSQGKVDISGSNLRISDTQVRKENEESKPWHAQVNIDKGLVNLNLLNESENSSEAKKLARSIKEQEIGSLLANADEELVISGDVSDLDWLNLLLDNPYELKIHGSGGIASDIRIKSGWLEAGSKFSILPQEISVEVLDYVSDGQGTLEFNITRGGENPDLSMDLGVKNAKFRRKTENQAMIEEVDMQLYGIARSIQLGDPVQDMQLQLKIPSARITDMSVYNDYLPEQSPLQVLGGQASLTADLTLEPDDADGYIHLDTHNLSARVDKQDVTARLTGRIMLKDGQPRDMAFDISDSTITLDEVRVTGEQDSFREEDWAADIRFDQANTVWKKPIQLDIEAALNMTNSIPLVSMLANRRGKHGWLENALTIDDVEGEVSLRVANQQIIIPRAFVSSDNIDVAAKAVIDKDTRNGMVFVRYKALKGLLKVKDGKRNIDILKAQEKFDNWSTETFLQGQEMAPD